MFGLAVVQPSVVFADTTFVPTLTAINDAAARPNGVKTVYKDRNVYFVAGNTTSLSDSTVFYSNPFLTNTATVTDKTTYTLTPNRIPSSNYTVSTVSQAAYNAVVIAGGKGLAFKMTDGTNTAYYKWNMPNLNTQYPNYFDAASTTAGTSYISFYEVADDGTLTQKYYNVKTLPNGGTRVDNSAVVDTITPSANDYWANLSYSSVGGAIWNEGTITNLTGDFISNVVTSGGGHSPCGGAMYNHGTITNLAGDFISNSAVDVGGAIWNEGTITNLTGDFIGNSVDGNSYPVSNGGAIYLAYNNATITNLTGNFIVNHARTDGGAIYNRYLSTIINITGDFIGNSAEHSAGAIRNDVFIANITGDFIANNARENAGAINNHASATITNITGSFIGNFAGRDGGAIFNENGGTITNLTGNFIDNSSNNSGGAIRNNGHITNITGNFTANVSNGGGGAIFNYDSATITNLTGDFIGNGSAYRGGAIYNTGTIANLTGSFIDNHTSNNNGGGAIFNASGVITVNATGRNIVFQGNEATVAGNGGAIYNNTGATFNLNADAGYKATFTAATATASNSIHNLGTMNLGTATKTGTIELLNAVTDGATPTGTINVNGANVTLSSTGGIKQKALNITAGSLTANAGKLDITNAIANAGALNLAGGTLSEVITGTGTTNITGGVSGSELAVTLASAADIQQNVVIDQYNSLTANTSQLDGTITNNGTLNLSGSLNKDIAGNNGTTKIDTTLGISGNSTVSGNFDMNNGTLNMQNSTAAYSTLNVKNLLGNGTLKIDADMTTTASNKATASDSINITGTGASNTINLTSVNVNNAGTYSRTRYNDYVTYLTGNLTGLSYQLNGSATGSLVTSTDNRKFTFTLGSAGKLNVMIETANLSLPDFIQGTNGGYIVDTYAINADMTLAAVDVGTTAGRSTPKTLSVNLNNGSDLTAAGTKQYAGITVDSGYTLNIDGSNAAGAKMTNFTTALTNKSGGTLNVKDIAFEGNTADIANEGALSLDGIISLEKGITGTNGTTVITGGTTTGSITQKSLTVNSTAALITDADTLNITDAIINNGTLTFNADGTNNNAITGTGSLIIGGAITNTSGKSIANAITINSGKSLTANAADINNSVSNNGTLNLTGGSINNAFSGSGINNITGDLVWGTGTSSGVDWTVANTGSLDIGSRAVNLGSGASTINGTLKMYVTDIAAGSNSYTGGSLTTTGALTLGAGSVLSLTVDGDIRGSTGDLQLISAGSYSGDFASMLDSNNRYKVLKGSVNGAYKITSAKTIRDIVTEGNGSENNVSSGEAWDSIGTGVLTDVSEQIRTTLNDLSQHDSAAYVKALEALAPSDSQRTSQIVRTVSELISNQVANRQQGTATGLTNGDVAAKTGVWIQGLANYAKQSSSSISSGLRGYESLGFTAKTAGFAIGLDGAVNDKTILGFGYAINHTDAEEDSGDTKVKGHTLFIYGKYQPSDWYIRGMVSYGFAKYDETADVAGIKIYSDYDVQNAGVSAMVGYNMQNGFTPEAGFRYLHINQGSYIDTAGQRIVNSDMNFVTAVLGIKYSKKFAAKEGVIWTPKVRLGLVYDLVSDNSKANVAIGAVNYSIHGKRLDRFGFEGELGLEADIDKFTLSLGYTIGLREKYYNHSGMLKVRYNF